MEIVLAKDIFKPDAEKLGVALRQARLVRSITLASMAKPIRLDVQTLEEIEAGARQISDAAVCAVSILFLIPVSELLIDLPSQTELTRKFNVSPELKLAIEFETLPESQQLHMRRLLWWILGGRRLVLKSYGQVME